MTPTQKTAGRRTALIISLLQLGALFLFFSHPSSARAQQGRDKTGAASPAATPKLSRTTTRHESKRFGYGSSLTILGAPVGSISIESWSKSEVDITADIELHADTEEDLGRLAAVNGFLLDDDVNRLRILTTGTHDKAYMRRTARDFPKRLLGLPWKIDYRIRVPAFTDIEIDAGRGDIKLAGVEGALRLTALEGNVTLNLTGGLVTATVGRGAVNITVGARSWRGAGLDIRLATGDLTLELPKGYSGEINAEVLRTGKIENAFTGLEPLERTTFTPRSIKARAGAGGPTLSLTVGDGTLRIKAVTSDE